MPFIYQADAWCDKCGQRIALELKQAGEAPANPSDESTYDSDDYPKRYYPDSETADSPQNCASGNCGNGSAAFLENGLTADGYKFLKTTLDGHGATLSAVAQEWADFYQFTYFKNPYSSAHDWLTQTLQTHAAEIQDRDGGNTHAAALVSIANEMADKLDADSIQDLFQSDMDAEDYFKQTGWYSPEME